MPLKFVPVIKDSFEELKTISNLQLEPGSVKPLIEVSDPGMDVSAVYNNMFVGTCQDFSPEQAPSFFKELKISTSNISNCTPVVRAEWSSELLKQISNDLFSLINGIAVRIPSKDAAQAAGIVYTVMLALDLYIDYADLILDFSYEKTGTSDEAAVSDVIRAVQSQALTRSLIALVDCKPESLKRLQKENSNVVFGGSLDTFLQAL